MVVRWAKSGYSPLIARAAARPSTRTMPKYCREWPGGFATKQRSNRPKTGGGMNPLKMRPRPGGGGCGLILIRLIPDYGECALGDA